MKKNLIIGASAIILILVGYFIVKGNKGEISTDIVVEVEEGVFEVVIETTGELEAKNSVKIMGPSALRDFRIFNMTIQDIVDEGTVVKKDDWIATLDKSEFQNRIQDKLIEHDKASSQYTQTQLDTTLQMRQSRDELINLKYAVEEQQIILDQSQFEPPATVKQAEINLEKAKRAYTQAVDNYKIKKRQNIEKMRQVAAELRKVQKELDDMNKLEASFIIRAPEPGMVIYRKGWDGKPIKEGSQVSTWDPTVATLPDLSTMMSKTYVNEVDVRKVKAGQFVQIGLDAFPEKKLTGKVIRVANVGEQRPNSDAKVFQVDIEVDGTDESLRPAMTTSNSIIAESIDYAIYVPLECLHSKDDSITFVYKKEGLKIIKQEVQVGTQNADEAVLLLGAKPGENVYLSIPPGHDGDKINLLEELNGKRMKKEEEKVEAEPEMKTITLPDGRTITVPADGKGQMPRGGGRRPQN